MSTTLYSTVETQLSSLISALNIPGERPRSLFHAVAGDALRCYITSGQRFSGIKSDGVPFEWSVSVGSKPGGLRFMSDYGHPGKSISMRVQHSRNKLSELTISLWSELTRNALERALDCLLPADDVLEATGALMGLWVGVGVTPNGEVNLKVYVNEEMGDIAASYHRFANCLAAFGRGSALKRLVDLVRAVGSQAIPVISAFDVHSGGIGRLKLYFRPRASTYTLFGEIAEAVGCIGVHDKITMVNHALLEGVSHPSCIGFSVEFPGDDGEVGYAVYLDVSQFPSGDAGVDHRVQKLLDMMEFTGEEYYAVRDIVVGTPLAAGPSHINIVSLAIRQDDARLNVYFHPSPANQLSKST